MLKPTASEIQAYAADYRPPPDQDIIPIKTVTEPDLPSVPVSALLQLLRLP